jgi:hypothetical protein
MIKGNGEVNIAGLTIKGDDATFPAEVAATRYLMPREDADHHAAALFQ